VSFPFEKPRSEKLFNTSETYNSEANWAAFDALVDEDIVINNDCPEMQADNFDRGILRFNGREPTADEIKEGMRLILNYLNGLGDQK
jgi:hypothetical protein